VILTFAALHALKPGQHILTEAIRNFLARDALSDEPIEGFG